MASLVCRASNASQRFSRCPQHVVCRAVVSGSWSAAPSQSCHLRYSSVKKHTLEQVGPYAPMQLRAYGRRGHEDAPLTANNDLYEDVFQPFGVSVEQFRQLMGFGTKCRAPAGETILEGGEPCSKIFVLLRGQAVAYRLPGFGNSTVDPDHSADPDFEDAFCAYRGKLGCEPDETVDAPLRGCVIGGSALVDASVAKKPYPCSIRTSQPTEWVEWDRAELLRIVNQPGMRALQASWYHTLYVELISSLEIDRKVKAIALQKDSAGDQANVPPPRMKQLAQLAIFIAIPFFGFGFADNFIMILCGDAIDNRFGAVLCLSTMAAAGLGNWVSDVVGLSLGDAIERAAEKLGLSNGRLTPRQQALPSAKWVALSARIIGISLGCFAGMCPLLFLSSNKKEFTNEDLDVYDKIFRPNGVEASQFAELMDMGKRQTANAGTEVVKGGQPFADLILVLHGEFDCFKEMVKEGKERRPFCTYIGRLEDSTDRYHNRKIPSRGSIIGGSALVDPSITKDYYPNTLVAKTHVEYISWNYQELRNFLDGEKALEASFVSMLYGELLERKKKDSTKQELETYRHLVKATLADGKVDDRERIFMAEMRMKFKITEQEHLDILEERGWNRESWEKGFRSKTLRKTSQIPEAEIAGAKEKDMGSVDTVEESLAKLQKAQELMDEAVASLREALKLESES